MITRGGGEYCVGGTVIDVIIGTADYSNWGGGVNWGGGGRSFL